jgi:hypothetical protein
VKILNWLLLNGDIELEPNGSSTGKGFEGISVDREYYQNKLADLSVGVQCVYNDDQFAAISERASRLYWEHNMLLSSKTLSV